MRALRTRAGFSQAAVGARIGRSASAIDRYEMGQRRIALSDLLRLADVFDVPLETLLGTRAARRRTAGPRASMLETPGAIAAEHRRLLRALDRRLTYPTAEATGGRTAEPVRRYVTRRVSCSDGELRGWAAEAGLPDDTPPEVLRRFAERVADCLDQGAVR